MSLPIAPTTGPRRFHQASWNEPIVFELSTPGERGVSITPVEPTVRDAVGDVLADLPEGMRRAAPPARARPCTGRCPRSGRRPRRSPTGTCRSCCRCWTE